MFPVFSDLMGNGKRVLRTGFSNRNLCVPFAQFETRWVFDVNGKQPMIPYSRDESRLMIQQNITIFLGVDYTILGNQSPPRDRPTGTVLERV